jgi:hypothetical protein
VESHPSASLRAGSFATRAKDGEASVGGGVGLTAGSSPGFQPGSEGQEFVVGCGATEVVA